MIKKEWKELLHSKWLKIVMIAILIIPCAYVCIFLGSMWDPYGNTKDIPVAVVNHDQKVSYENEMLDVGNDLVKNLEDSDAMKFQCVDEEEAEKGLEDGKYYMVITIPKDFSSNATTLLDEKPKNMVLQYTTNPGTNYIASKMDDSAISQIKEEVSSQVTKTYAKTIFEQIGTVSNGLKEAADGSHKLLDGVNQLSDGNKEISDNLNVLASSSLTFKDGANTLEVGSKDYTDGVLSVHDGITTLKDGVTTLKKATPQLSQGIQQLDEGSSELANGVSQYTQGVSQAYAGTQELVKNNAILKEGTKALSEGTKSLVAGNEQIVQGVNLLSEEISKGKVSLDSYLALYEKLNSNIVTQEYAKELKENGLTKEQLAQFGIHVESDLPSFEGMLKMLDGNLAQLQTAVGDQGLRTGVLTLQNGLTQLDSKVNDENLGLVSGLNRYIAGVEQVNNGLAQITQNNDRLNAGSKQLAAGTKSLSNKTPVLIDGISQLHQGTNQLFDGTSTLVANNQTLTNGSKELAKGANLIQDGASQLANGSMTLGDGLKEAKEGTTTLHTGLQDGAKESNIQTSDDTFTMMSAPLTTKHVETSVVKNNGHAMAPYMMSVALYVACMAFVLMFPLMKHVEDAKNGFTYWLGKASVWFVISTLAAVAMVGSLILINGFAPENIGETFMFAVLVSAAFMALITLLSITCGKIGEFVLLIFMVINLGGSAGTYPLETAGAFYKSIHAYVPFTYSVNGFRKVISMSNASLSTECMVFAGILIVCSILTILIYQYRNKKPQPFLPQAFEHVNE